jgi:hypothetical protein
LNPGADQLRFLKLIGAVRFRHFAAGRPVAVAKAA